MLTTRQPRKLSGRRQAGRGSEIAAGSGRQHLRSFLKFLYNCIPSSRKYCYAHFRGEETEAREEEPLCEWGCRAG